jgi:transposase-like protein
MEQCPICGGFAEWMGTLGTLNWFTCQSCGMQFNVEMTEEEIKEAQMYDEEYE